MSYSPRNVHHTYLFAANPPTPSTALFNTYPYLLLKYFYTFHCTACRLVLSSLVVWITMKSFKSTSLSLTFFFSFFVFCFLSSLRAASMFTALWFLIAWCVSLSYLHLSSSELALFSRYWLSNIFTSADIPVRLLLFYVLTGCNGLDLLISPSVLLALLRISIV